MIVIINLYIYFLELGSIKMIIRVITGFLTGDRGLFLRFQFVSSTHKNNFELQFLLISFDQSVV